MSSTTFSELQKKFAQADENPPVAAPSVPETPVETPAVETPISTPDAAAATPTPTPEPTPTAIPEPSSNGSADVADFEISFGDDTPDAAQAAQQPATPQFNIEEEIKKIPKTELLKKLGVNDFIIQMDEHYSKGGKIDDFVYAKGIDYNQVSDEDLIKSDLRKEYPNFSKEDIDELFLAKYKDIDSQVEDDPDKRRAQLQLRADAFKVRQAKIAEQQNFKFPDPLAIKDEAYEQWKQQKEASQKQYENQVNYYTNHEATKKLIESKRVAVSFGEGVPPLKFVVDKPELITRAMTDDGTIMSKLMSTQSGEPDVEKEQLFTLFAFNPQKFIQTIFNYGAQQGVYKKLVNENQNAQRPGTPVQPTSPDAKPVFRNSTFGQVMRNGVS